MRRPQFSLKTLLWLMAVVAAFFAGARVTALQWAREKTQLLDEVDDWSSRAITAENENDRLRVREYHERDQVRFQEL